MCLFSIFMSNYIAYNLFHGFCVLISLTYCCNRSTNHMTSSGEAISEDDARHRKRDEDRGIRR